MSKEKKRSDGEGTIYHNKAKNKWVGQVTVAWLPDGKRKIKTVYGATPREVSEKLAAIKVARKNGTLRDAGKVTVAEHLADCLDAAKASLKPSTLVGYEVSVRCHIAPFLGKVNLGKLEACHIEALYADMLAKGKSRGTVRQVHAVLHRALARAVKQRLLAINVASEVEVPKPDRKALRVLTREEAQRFMRIARFDRHYALYAVAIATGMRAGELHGLQWHDVDLDRGTIHVQRSLGDVKGRLVLGNPKTNRSRRMIVMPQFVKDVLLDHRRRAEEEGLESPFVFCDGDGGPIRHNNFTRRSFKPLLEDAGLPKLRFHDLRHSAATLMLAAGTHPKLVQEILGHSNINVTMDIYSHVIPAMHGEAAKAMDGLLRPRRDSRVTVRRVV